MEPRPLPDIYRDMTLDQAVADIGNTIYASSGLFEDLENAGHIHVNGHHLRQQLAEYAQKLLHDAWVKPDDTPSLQ